MAGKRSRRLGLISLGCAKNEVDAERILGAAAEAGWLICGDPADADVVVVNTCGFIAPAKSESLDAIEEALELKRAGACRAVVVAGCLAERYGRELREELPEVDAWVGIADPRGIPDVAAAALAGKANEPLVQIPPLPGPPAGGGTRPSSSPSSAPHPACYPRSP